MKRTYGSLSTPSLEDSRRDSVKRTKGFRRGELRDHALSIIIGVIALGIMLYAGWLLMAAYTLDDHDKAEGALKSINRKIKALDAGETTRFPLQGPEGWYLQGWGVEDARRPERCYFSSCICVCKEAGKEGAASCQDPQAGTCIFVEEREVAIAFVGKVNQVVGVAAVAGEGAVLPLKGTCPVIPFEGNLLELVLERERNRVSITHRSDRAIDGALCSR